MLNRVFRAAFFIVVVLTSPTLAQTPAASNRPYDGIQAGLDAYRLGEEQRQVALSQELFLNNQMRFWNGYPVTSTTYYGYLPPTAMAAYGYGVPATGFGSGIASPLMTQANLDYAYAYGAGPLWNGYGGYGPLSVFQPWPYMPGWIYGYPAYYLPARQPIGQQQSQTGPNRWESHPIYDPPLTSYQPPPPVASPLLDRTPYASLPPPAAPTEAIPPEPPRSTGSPSIDVAPLVPATPAAPSAPRRGPQER